MFANRVLNKAYPLRLINEIWFPLFWLASSQPIPSSKDILGREGSRQQESAWVSLLANQEWWPIFFNRLDRRDFLGGDERDVSKDPINSVAVSRILLSKYCMSTVILTFYNWFRVCAVPSTFVICLWGILLFCGFWLWWGFLSRGLWRLARAAVKKFGRRAACILHGGHHVADIVSDRHCCIKVVEDWISWVDFWKWIRLALININAPKESKCIQLMSAQNKFLTLPCRTRPKHIYFNKPHPTQPTLQNNKYTSPQWVRWTNPKPRVIMLGHSAERHLDPRPKPQPSVWHAWHQLARRFISSFFFFFFFSMIHIGLVRGALFRREFCPILTYSARLWLHTVTCQ